MDRGEFLSILRESLEGLIPMEEVENNLDFYRNYFEESEKSDREVIEELGDPRLIARTIIDAYKASKGPMADFYTEQARSEYARQHDDSLNRGSSHFGGEARWHEKLFGWLVIFLVLGVVLILAVTVVRVLIYVLPVILLIVVIKILADIFRR